MYVKSVHIYNIKDDSWDTGTHRPFPVGIRSHAWTRYEDSFLIAGGMGGGGTNDAVNYDKIYRFGQNVHCTDIRVL